MGREKRKTREEKWFSVLTKKHKQAGNLQSFWKIYKTENDLVGGYR